jgi:hypothetical protein
MDCCLCGKVMGPSTRPYWVFGKQWELLGQAHSLCTIQKQHRERASPVDHAPPLAVLRFHRWTMTQGQDAGRDDLYAALLADRAEHVPTDGTLEPGQRHLIEWWHEGPLAMPNYRLEAIKAQYAGLVARYHAAALPPLPEE